MFRNAQRARRREWKRRETGELLSLPGLPGAVFATTRTTERDDDRGVSQEHRPAANASSIVQHVVLHYCSSRCSERIRGCSEAALVRFLLFISLAFLFLFPSPRSVSPSGNIRLLSIKATYHLNRLIWVKLVKLSGDSWSRIWQSYFYIDWEIPSPRDVEVTYLYICLAVLSRVFSLR